MKISAKNQLKGKIVSITKGAINGTVVIDIGNGNKITSTISLQSIEELGLVEGKEAYAIIKATSVMIGVE
ncbi:MAG: TOBE domain-containing protein [Campylobacteraceae bacterium]|nr:TOBE domain-containing protein [Campylobacteraceae bacterium]